MAANHRLTPVDPFRVLNSAGHPEEFDLVELISLQFGSTRFASCRATPGNQTGIRPTPKGVRYAAAP